MGASLMRRIADDVDLAALHATYPDRYPCLLESSARHPERGRYDILFAAPGEALTYDAHGRLAGPCADRGRFLDALEAWWRTEGSQSEPGRLPFGGGWVLLLGYELAGEIEPSLALPPAPGGWPTAVALRVRAAIVRDRYEGELWLVGEPDDPERLDRMLRDIESLSVAGVRTHAPAAIHLAEEEDARFLAGVERIREWLRAGDVFQVNLSRCWRARGDIPFDAALLLHRLRQTNPAPFAGILRLGDLAVVSSSPERLVERRGDIVRTRPIAGTKPRGANEASDRAFSTELTGSLKERAEHLMLIDLERNDLGRVCVPGSVRAEDLMSVESYAHVHHIVSGVTGRLRPGTGPAELIRAVFPGGTITGCPKVRAMQIIADLEREGRGPYTGSLGYLDRSGDLDLNILIRSFAVQGNELWLRAGAGIVWDSVASAELAETRHKARGLLRALTGADGP